jgi:hypothetical protein
VATKKTRDVGGRLGRRPDGTDEAREVVLAGLPDAEQRVVDLVLLDGAGLEGDLQGALLRPVQGPVPDQHRDVVAEHLVVHPEVLACILVVDASVALDQVVDLLSLRSLEGRLLLELHTTPVYRLRT